MVRCLSSKSGQQGIAGLQSHARARTHTHTRIMFTELWTAERSALRDEFKASENRESIIDGGKSISDWRINLAMTESFFSMEREENYQVITDWNIFSGF